ncbi:hypothetical protein RRG08_036736 [Elysia crispata]|uniref:Uncharacterized protein n=1 Tax=Elysia crispata TaxID=231223 RepID=A0AAE1CM88_9GAST|nr:hypothetical protein RRG08_036736 [Elysia crispata]
MPIQTGSKLDVLQPHARSRIALKERSCQSVNSLLNFGIPWKSENILLTERSSARNGRETVVLAQTPDFVAGFEKDREKY